MGNLNVRNLHWSLKYVIALVFVSGALLLNSLPAVKATPFLFFFGAVAVTARICGFGPALFCTLLSAVAADYFVASTPFVLSRSPAELLRLTSFVLVCILISSIAKQSSQLERIAAEKQAQLAAIVECSEDAIFSKTLDGTITSWNDGAERVYGWTAEEIIGKNVMVIVAPNRQAEIRDILKKLSQGQKIEHHETQRVRKDGSHIDVSVSVAPLLDSAGKIIGAASIARDITGRKLTDETLRKTEKLAAAGRLAATVAHEINNPLASMTNLLYLLRSNRSLDAKGRNHLALAEQEMKRVAHLARQTLGFYRDSASPVLIDLRAALEEVLGIYAPKLEAKRIFVQKDYEDGVEVNAFAGEVRQVFSNLIANAIDAMDIDGRLLVRVARSADWRQLNSRGGRVTIADSGSGISEEHKRRLFEPFYTTKKEVGTGLGLWVSKEIVLKHGGAIVVRSSVKLGRQGTVFSLFFPAALDAGRIGAIPERSMSSILGQANTSRIA